MIGESVKHLCENPKNYHVHCVGAMTQVIISTRHKFSLRRNIDKSMYTRVFCTRVKSYGLCRLCPHQQLQSIVECSTLTDECSSRTYVALCTSSWLSQSLDFDVGQICVFSASAFLLVLKFFSVLCSFLDCAGASCSMVPNGVQFASYHQWAMIVAISIS